MPLMQKQKTVFEMENYDCDLIVIGGGSGGLATSKKAVECGAKNVTLFDYVRPTEPHGIRWGLGGTCVNAGCIPKKIMHFAAKIAPGIKHSSNSFGHKVESYIFDWKVLIKNIDNYVKMLNYTYRNSLRSKNIKYINALAKLIGPHRVQYIDNSGQEHELTAKYILISVGGRPHVPPEDEVPGAKQYAITSDDLFYWDKPPGKTLVVGASYIGLECAGFLTDLGYDTTVAVRSHVLRGFDRQCAEKVKFIMQECGTKFISVLPQKIMKNPNGKLLVEFVNGAKEEYETVLYATGRSPDTRNLNLNSVGVLTNEKGKIIVKNFETSISNIFAVGDVADSGPELTPVAIKCGESLALRLFKNLDVLPNLKYIPTTVFTPVEYGCIGYTEEAAIEEFGADNIEIFLQEFKSLELAAFHRPKSEATKTNEYDLEMGRDCLSKLICLKTENMRVIGFHFVGPNAGEITQGYALALNLKASKADFDNTMCIHPTVAESFHGLTITKKSNQNFVSGGGCGGGKCG